MVCSIGSTDPTGAAGIGLDQKVFAELGAAGVFAVAAVTAQNSSGVRCVAPLAPKTILAQLESIWSQVEPDAVRVGLLPRARQIRAVEQFLASRRIPIVVDPVLAASSGPRFCGPREIAALKRLFRLAAVATPNAVEAAELARVDVRSVADAERAALALQRRYGCAVLVKGGHLRTAVAIDVLAHRGRIERFSSPRQRRRVRGTGCMLAAALAVGLARRRTLRRAIRDARAFVRAKIVAAQPLGKGKPQL